MLPEKDLVRLHHMYDAARETLGFATGHTRHDLDSDRMLLFALVRGIEIIGEAAANVSAETRKAVPNVEWGRIVGMRNRLIHAYFTVNSSAVWGTVREDLAPLLAALEPYVGPTDAEVSPDSCHEADRPPSH